MDRREIDRRDQELLNKQLRRFSPAPRTGGTMILALVAVFLAGMTAGAFSFGYKGEPMRMAVMAAALAQPINALPIAQ
ncbi:MAG: hypothetical protein ACLPX7_04260 [Xanthobacteraceae bacterium]